MPKIDKDTAKRASGDGALGTHEALLLSESGGLTQFAAIVETLAPGARSSYAHWHESEDEMILMLEGRVILHEGDEDVVLEAGDCATFVAGDPAGHCLENQNKSPARYLVVGARAPRDRVHYPAEDRILHIERSNGDKRWTNSRGAPATPLPK